MRIVGKHSPLSSQSEVQNEALARKVIVMNVVVDFLKKIATTGPANLTDDVRIATRRTRDVLHPWIRYVDFISFAMVLK